MRDSLSVRDRGGSWRSVADSGDFVVPRDRGYSKSSRVSSTVTRVSKDSNNNTTDYLDRSEGELSEEDEDSGSSSRYARRLALVNEYCELGLQPKESEQVTAFGSRESARLVRLPPAEGFGIMFDKVMIEAKGKKGSKRAKNEAKLPLEVGKFPARNKPNINAIEPEGQPWLVNSSQTNTSLSSSQAFNFQGNPKVVMDQERLRIWECSAREEFSLASCNTWFLKASRIGLDKAQESLEGLKKKKKLTDDDWAELWQKMENVQELIDAAGIGAKKMAENAVSDIGSMLLMRRDAWLKKLVESRVITKQDMWDLRLADLNEKLLFNQEDLERIHDKAQKRESETMTKKIWDNIVREKKDGPSQSFRGGPPGQRGRGFAGSSNRGGQPARFNRGRGGRGRGGRGGRPNPFKTEQSTFPPAGQSSGGK